MTKENITERVKGGGGGVSTPKININIPKVGSGGSGGRNNPGGGSTTSEISTKSTSGVMSNIPKGEGSAVIDGKKLNPNFGKKVKIDTSKGPDVIEPENQSKEFGPGGQPSASVQIKKSRLAGKTGKERAQELAKMRIASGKTIQQVKDENTKSMRAKAKERFEKFKADREAKRLERMKEEYTPYDMVLEYLLSTEQAATIEEANYVMMQLDEENIQEIVGTVAKAIMKTPLVKLVPAAIGTGIATKMIASRMGKKSGENEIKNSTPPVPMGTDKKKSDPIKDLIPNIKKRNKALEDAIEKS